MTTLTDSRPNGSPQDVGDRLRLEPHRRAERRPRTAWIALALVLLLGFGLLGAVTIARVADRTPVLALAEPIGRGETLTSEHLTVLEVGVDDGAAFVPTTSRDEILGRPAAASLDAGTILTPSLFFDGPQAGRGQAVVGLALEPGEYPTSTLGPGDYVIVVRSPLTSNAVDRTEAPADVLAADVEVFSVEVLSDAARTLMVSVTVPRDVAADITSAAAAGRIRLVLVDRP